MEKEVNVEREHYPVGHFISDIWFFLQPYKLKFIFWSFIRIVSSIIFLITPIIFGWVVDELAGQKDVTKIIKFVAIFSVLELIGPSIRLTSKYHLGEINYALSRHLRLAGLSKLVELDLSWHEENMVGAVMRKITKGVDSVADTIKFMAEDGYEVIVSFIGAIIVFSYFDIKYLLIVILFAIFYLYAEFHHDKKLTAQRKILNVAHEDLYSRAFEFVANIRTVKSLGLEKTAIKETQKKESVAVKEGIKSINMGIYKWKVIQTIGAFFKTIFFVVLCYDIIKGNLSVGILFIYFNYFGKVHSGLNSISSSVDKFIEWKVSLHRFMQILDNHSEIDAGKNLLQVDSIKSIKLDKLSFQYKDQLVLSDVSLEVKQGQKLGIVGQSGVDKSTLFKLLLKLYSPKEGDILVNDISINKIKRHSITNNLTIVPQDTELFNLSFKENVIVSKPGKINEKLYKRAVEIAQCNVIIAKLPYGDKSIIGEKGIRLSGGERQRLGIARAIYKDADVILLDESTSHLDSNTETQILLNVEKQLANKTLIVIAHRLSTLKTMDRIVVFSQGSIVEEGSYDELLEEHGIFYELNRLQQKNV